MTRRSRLLARVLLSLGMGIAALYGLWRVSDLRGWQAFGTIVPRVEVREKVVALTFDDGPTPAGADSILPLLDSLGVRATFFVNGNALAERPDVGRRFVRAGHELGNHTWSHPRMLLQPQATIRREVERTDSMIRVVGHAGPIHFRPPYGKKLGTCTAPAARRSRGTWSRRAIRRWTATRGASPRTCWSRRGRAASSCST